MGGVARCPASAEGYVEWMTQCTAIAQQHRNKIAFQARQILSTILTTSAGADADWVPAILSITSGAANDVRSALPFIRDSAFTLVLNDFDDRALAYSSGRLESIKDRVITVSGNIFTRLHQIARHGPYDLISEVSSTT